VVERRRAPYGLGMFFSRQVSLFAVFEDPVTELGDEIWRRKEALGAIQPDETDPAAPTAAGVRAAHCDMSHFSIVLGHASRVGLGSVAMN